MVRQKSPHHQDPTRQIGDPLPKPGSALTPFDALSDGELDRRAWLVMRPDLVDLRLQGCDPFAAARLLEEKWAPPLEAAYFFEMMQLHTTTSQAPGPVHSTHNVSGDSR